MSESELWEQQDLDRLRFHWGEAYSITMYGTEWRALYRAAATPPLIADTADGLLEKIRADYYERRETDRGKQ